MQRYIEQLIEDLEYVAQHPPTPSYFEAPPQLEHDASLSELALVPFKTIEELTGINQEVFPEIIDLHGDQCEKVNKAIFKVFESLHIDLIDVPSDIPPEWLYEVLSTNWQHPVQYLPSSGMDLELCTGDYMTCPYGEYCSCYEESEDPEPYEMPEMIMALAKSIAESIDCGLIVYLNLDTLDLEEVSAEMEDPEDFDSNFSQCDWVERPKFYDWENTIRFEPLEAHESYKMMEAFVENMEDEQLQAELFNAMDNQKPFAHFNGIIDNSEFRQNWFDFKQHYLENHVQILLSKEIHGKH